MTHTLHRCGTVENLKNDFVFYLRAFIIEDSYPQRQKIWEILLSEGPVNSRFRAEKIQDPSEYLKKYRGFGDTFFYMCFQFK